MHFVSLGDSITYGNGASRPSLAYPSVLANLLREGRGPGHVYGDILAQPGWTSEALATTLLQTPPWPLRTARAVIIWIGGDDLAYAALRSIGQPKAAIGRQLKGALAAYGLYLARTIAEIRTVSKAPVFVCTQYNPFPNSPIATEGIQALNQAMIKVASSTGAAVVPTGEWFAGRQAQLIRGYRTGTLQDVTRRPIPIHPNNLGHRVIADGLYGVVEPIVSR